MSESGRLPSESEKDTLRAMAAAKAIIDDRDPEASFAAILVTLEHAVATVLLCVSDRSPHKAAAMLNEGLLQGVETRLSFYAAANRKV